MNSTDSIRSSNYEITEDRYGFVDKLVRASKEIIILLLLLERPMSGFELIKEILMRSNVFLSQGYVYATLYSLEEEGIIMAKHEKADMRTKRYFVTPFGIDLAQNITKEFNEALCLVYSLVYSTTTPSVDEESKKNLINLIFGLFLILSGSCSCNIFESDKKLV